MGKFFIIILCVSFVGTGCNNMLQPDNPDLSIRGLLDRSRQSLNEKKFDEAKSDVNQAMSSADTLSEAYYLLAQIAGWQYRTDIIIVKGAITIGGKSELSDTNPMPFSEYSIARKDSMLQGNLKILENLEIIKSGKTPDSHKALDTVYIFKDFRLDYVVTCEVLGIISLFDLDTNGVIDSLDSIAIKDMKYRYNNSGFTLFDTSSSSQAIENAAAKSTVYFKKADLLTDSLLVPFEGKEKTDAYVFRKNIRKTVNNFLNNLPALVSSKLTRRRAQ